MSTLAYTDRVKPRNHDPHLRKWLHRIKVPTLLIWGEEDPALGPSIPRATRRHVADLTLRMLPGVSHWAQQEAPQTVNAMLEAWLAGRRVPEGIPGAGRPARRRPPS